MIKAIKLSVFKALSSLIALSLALSLFSCKENNLEVPNFKAINESGEDVMLSDFLGKPILLNFWATWCDPCKAEMPEFESAYREYKDRVNFVIVNLTDINESVSKAQSYVASRGYTFPLYFDVYGEADAEYEISSIPRTYFLNSRGELVHKVFRRISAAELASGIASILSE